MWDVMTCQLAGYFYPAPLSTILSTDNTNSIFHIPTMSRPDFGRTASTNLSGSSGPRQLEGKLAIVTGASRGMHPKPRTTKTRKERALTNKASAPPSAATSPARAPRSS